MLADKNICYKMMIRFTSVIHIKKIMNVICDHIWEIQPGREKSITILPLTSNKYVIVQIGSQFDASSLFFFFISISIFVLE